MRLSLALALSASFLMILGASWARFGAAEEYSSGLLAIAQSEEFIQDYRQIIESQTIATSSPSISDERLTDTDLIARQLVLDYVNLATTGHATPENLQKLADKYIESIPTLDKSVKISPTELKAVPNTTENFREYAALGTQIEMEYERKVMDAYARAKNFTVLGPELYSLSSEVSRAYADAAGKFRGMNVPYAAVEVHSRLVNAYLSSAAAMKAVSETDEDPSVAFAGIIMLDSNLTSERAILAEITKIIESHGI